jgi:hypothetical protein
MWGIKLNHQQDGTATFLIYGENYNGVDDIDAAKRMIDGLLDTTGAVAGPDQSIELVLNDKPVVVKVYATDGDRLAVEVEGPNERNQEM